MGQKGITEIQGEVLEALPNTLFKVKLTDERVILCHLGGKLRLHRIRVMPGDSVKVEMTPYDLDKGRIVYRIK